MPKPTRSIGRLVAFSACIVAAAIACTAVFVVLPAERQIRLTHARVDHAQQVIAAIDRITADVAAAESSQFSFLLTANARFLQPYDNSVRNVWRHFAELQQLTNDDRTQSNRLPALHELLDSWLALLAQSLELARSDNRQAALDQIGQGPGEAPTGPLRDVAAAIAAQEQSQLGADRLENARAQQRSDDITHLLLLVAGCGILLAGIATAAAVKSAMSTREAAALAADRARRLDLLDSAPTMIRDFAGKVLVWSEGCQRLYGWTAAQAIGQSWHTLLQSVGPVPPGEISARLLGAGEWRGELRQRTRDGVEVIVLVDTVLRRDIGHSALRVIETVIDVTALRRSQNVLLAAQAQFRSLLNAVADAIIIAHGDGRIQTINQAVLRMFGFDSDAQLVGRDLIAVLPTIATAIPGSGTGDRRSGALSSCPGFAPMIAIRRDGSEFPVDLSVTDFEADDQSYRIAIIRDIADRRDAETALRDSEERLRRFVDNAPAAIAMFDPTMHYLAVSRRYAVSRLLATDHEVQDQTSLLGRSHYDLFPEMSERRRAEHARVLAGESASGEAEPYILRNGLTAWVRWEAVPWRQADGSIGGTMLVLEDVTERKVAEMALYDSEARLRLVQQVGGIAYTDQTLPDTTAEVSSEYAAMHGLPPGQSRVSVAEFIARVHPDDRDRIAAVTPASLVQGKLATEFRIVRPDQEVRWLSVRIEGFLGPDGQPNRIISAQQDITEIVAARETLARRHDELKRLSHHLIKARNRAERESRAKSRFLAGMSHELRTPLNGIIGYAHLLHIEGGLTPAQGARVDAMLKAGEHLLQMINCVLDLSEIEAEHIELRPVEFNVLTIASACLELLRPAAELKQLTLDIIVAPDTSMILTADPTRLRQVLLNLLGNAVKFTSQGGVELCLRSATDGAAMRIEVRDSGPGIPADLHKQLFQDFERLDTTAVEGAGLGLALSARLAIVMGGRLDHEDNPTGGSIFWLELPWKPTEKASPPELAAVDLPATPPPPPTPPKLRVLVVDDVLMNRDIASSFLRAAGHEVVCMDSGEAAVVAAASTDFNVVLMDVRMPGIDGLEATRRIRDLGGSRGRVPIVALTAQAFTEQVADCRRAGMDDHLSKPFSPDQLLAAVSRATAAPPSQADNLRPATTPAAPVDHVIGEELLVFDRKTFQRTAAFLSPEAVAAYLETVTTNAQALLDALNEPGPALRAGSQLAAMAHALAGSAGMLGFERLAAVAGRFEQAVQSGAPDAHAIQVGLCAALQATILSVADCKLTTVDS